VVGAVLVLWRLREKQVAEQIKDLADRVDELEKQIAEWQRKWADEVKEHAKTASLSLRALEKRRGESSSQPPSSS
jgi:phage host-nuclease inhibitor protein Gam